VLDLHSSLRSTTPPIEEDLPVSRVNPSSPFAHAGIDYADPFIVTPFVGHGQRTRKNIRYVTCLSRYSGHPSGACRGLLCSDFPHHFSAVVADLYSDNATNFHGANRELHRCFAALIEDSFLRTTWQRTESIGILSRRPLLILVVFGWASRV